MSGGAVPGSEGSVGPQGPPRLDPDAWCGLEALLFLADEPVAVETLAEVVEVDPETVSEAVGRLAQRYRDEGRGLEIRQVGGAWRMYTAPAARPFVERWALAGRTGRLSQAALETLAVITYKQPIGRQEIGEIRGVNADGAVRSLLARGLVHQVGRDDGPGQAALFGTTPLLLERLGLSSLEELPPLTEFLPEAPAPDEPELGAFKELRRRLAAGGQLPTRGIGGRSDRETNTGPDPDTEGDADELLPPPASPRRGRDEEMDDLTDRLERAARQAVERLRSSVDPDVDRSGEDDVPGDGREPPASPRDGDDSGVEPRGGEPTDG